MEIKKKVLVLMATYNGEKYIEQQLNSILNQISVNVEILIRDDGSTDNTMLIISKFIKGDSRVHVIHAEKNEIHGPMYNFYNIINIAKGCYLNDFDYFAFSDQDDIWHLDKLKIMTKAFKQNSLPQLAYADYEVIDKEGRLVLKSADEQLGLCAINPATLLFTNSFAWGHSIIFNQELLRQIVIDKEVMTSNFPHDAYFAKFAVITGGLIYVPNVLVSYRRYTSNVSQIWFKLSPKVLFKQFIKEKYVYANIVNATLLTFEKNKNNALVDHKMTEDVKSVFFEGGFRALLYIYRNRINRKQKSRSIALKFIYFWSIYKKYINRKHKIKTN